MKYLVIPCSGVDRNPALIADRAMMILTALQLRGRFDSWAFSQADLDAARFVDDDSVDHDV